MTRNSSLLSIAGPVPAKIAAESAECGLVCLAMIGEAFGHRVSLDTLRSRHKVSLHGLTLRDLVHIGHDMGLAARALKIEYNDLAGLATPCILHWNLDHFVVLTKYSTRCLYINDPSRGRRVISAVEARRAFTGVAVEFTPLPGIARIIEKNRVPIKWLAPALKTVKSAIAQAMALSLIIQVCLFATPLYLQLCLDTSHSLLNEDAIERLTFAFLGLVILSSVVDPLRDRILQYIGAALARGHVRAVVNHLLHVNLEYIRKRHIGDTISRIESTSIIQDYLSQAVISAIFDAPMATLALVMMASYSIPLLIIAVVTVAITSGIELLTFSYIKTKSENALHYTSIERSHLIESVRALTTLRVMGKEADRMTRWQALYDDAASATLSLAKTRTIAESSQKLIAGVSLVISIFVAIKAPPVGNVLSAGMIMAFLMYRQSFIDRVSTILKSVTKGRLIWMHIERTADILRADAEEELDERERTELDGAISIDGVSFRFDGRPQLLLTNVDLEIYEGDFIAITGPSGGGKTTFLHILLGLRVPSTGEIRLNGHRADPPAFRSWRRSVGVVSQDDLLFSGSIAENISFFAEFIDLAEVERAARAAEIHHDIMALPMTYLTHVGEMGSGLSGGQRQRILLARALYKKPKVLVLDEGTANLDVHTERLIADTISRLPLTRIVVAHRPALINRASRVVTVSDGLVVEDARSRAPESHTILQGLQAHPF